MTLTGNTHEIEWLTQSMPGWRGLLNGLRHELERKDFEIYVDQVKEKFGGLRFYWTIPDEDRQRYEVVTELVDSFERVSYHLCCVCGDGATGPGPRQWVLYYCDAHKFENLAELRKGSLGEGGERQSPDTP